MDSCTVKTFNALEVQGAAGVLWVQWQPKSYQSRKGKEVCHEFLTCLAAPVAYDKKPSVI